MKCLPNLSFSSSSQKCCFFFNTVSHLKTISLISLLTLSPVWPPRCLLPTTTWIIFLKLWCDHVTSLIKNLQCFSITYKSGLSTVSLAVKTLQVSFSKSSLLWTRKNSSQVPLAFPSEDTSPTSLGLVQAIYLPEMCLSLLLLP